jgi:hypothetical protein
MVMTASERIRAAEEVVDQLRARFAEVGVTLPSLRVDPLSCNQHGAVSAGGAGALQSGYGAAARGRTAGGAVMSTERVEYGVDSRDGRVGQVMGREGGYVQLRPPAGGREWDCPLDVLSVAPPGEVLRARVRGLNRAGRLP